MCVVVRTLKLRFNDLCFRATSKATTYPTRDNLVACDEAGDITMRGQLLEREKEIYKDLYRLRTFK